MIAVIATGGKQYIVKTGQTIKVEKLPGVVGDTVSFNEVLLTANDAGEDVRIGTPYIDGVSVSGEILKQAKHRTVRVEKFKRKVRYHKVHGQRQRYTELKIL